jgi:hypothetical protein
MPVSRRSRRTINCRRDSGETRKKNRSRVTEVTRE